MLNQWSSLDSLKTISTGTGIRESTDGIDMIEWKISKNRKIRFWDFAGQRLFYTTHQFFLSNSTVTILVFKVLDSLSTNLLDFWLHSIQYHAPGSRILIIGTYIDQLPVNTASEKIIEISKYLESIIDKVVTVVPEDRKKLTIIPCLSWFDGKKKVESSLVFWPVSCTKNWGIDQISFILKSFTWASPVEKKFISLTNEIISIRKKLTVPIIDISELRSMIEKNYEKNIGLYQIRTQLHELGIILDFGDNFNKILIDPQWLSNLFRCVVSLKSSNETSNGIIPLKQVISNMKTILQSDSHQQEFLLQILKQFEIIIKQPQSEFVIIPCLISDTEPSEIQASFKLLTETSNEILGRIYVLTFLPSELMSRLFIKVCEVLQPNTKFWKTGIFLHMKGSYLLLKVEHEKDSIQCSIKISCVGHSPQTLILNFDFLFSNLLANDFPLLFETTQKIVFYSENNEEYRASFTDCVNQWKETGYVKSEQGKIFDPKKIIPEEFNDQTGEAQFDINCMNPGKILGSGK